MKAISGAIPGQQLAGRGRRGGSGRFRGAWRGDSARRDRPQAGLAAEAAATVKSRGLRGLDRQRIGNACIPGWAGLMAIVYATLAQGAAPAPAAKPDLERGKQIAVDRLRGLPRRRRQQPRAGQSDPRRPACRLPRRPARRLQVGRARKPDHGGHVRGAHARRTCATSRPSSRSRPRSRRAAKDKALAARGQQIWRGGIRAGQRSRLRRLPWRRGRRHPVAVSPARGPVRRPHARLAQGLRERRAARTP